MLIGEKKQRATYVALSVRDANSGSSTRRRAVGSFAVRGPDPDAVFAALLRTARSLVGPKPRRRPRRTR